MFERRRVTRDCFGDFVNCGLDVRSSTGPQRPDLVVHRRAIIHVLDWDKPLRVTIKRQYPSTVLREEEG